MMRIAALVLCVLVLVAATACATGKAVDGSGQELDPGLRRFEASATQLFADRLLEANDLKERAARVALLASGLIELQVFRVEFFDTGEAWAAQFDAETLIQLVERIRAEKEGYFVNTELARATVVLRRAVLRVARNRVSRLLTLDADVVMREARLLFVQDEAGAAILSDLAFIVSAWRQGAIDEAVVWDQALDRLRRNKEALKAIGAGGEGKP
jgi:hypothetical protein